MLNIHDYMIAFYFSDLAVGLLCCDQPADNHHLKKSEATY